MAGQCDPAEAAAKRLVQILRGATIDTQQSGSSSLGAAKSLLRRSRDTQVELRTKTQRGGLQARKRLVNVYMVERSVNNLQWKRCSEMVTIGTLKDSDNLDTVKEKCADAFHLSVPTELLVLVRAAAKIDATAFTSLGEFLSCLSAQQQGKISFGIGSEEDVTSPPPSLPRLARSRHSRVDDDVSSSSGSKHSVSRSRGSFSSQHSRGVSREMRGSRSRSRSPSGATSQTSVVPTYSFAVLMEATEGKSSTMKLGSGGFGDVYMGTLRHAMVAIKFFREGNENLMSSIDSLTKEANILSRYRHSNLVSIYGVCKDVQHPAVVYELMSNGSLHECIMGKTQNSRYLGHIAQRIRNLHEAACGLAFLHSTDGGLASVIHLDVKTTNILLDEHFVAKLGDFGFARQVPTCHAGKSFFRISASYGTPGYQAPECARGEICPKVDVFSFGVVILEVFSELPAYSTKRKIAALHEFFEESLDPAELEAFKGLVGLRLKRASVTWKVQIPYQPLQQLAKRCLSVRHRRPNMEEVVAVLEELRHVKLEAVEVL